MSFKRERSKPKQTMCLYLFVLSFIFRSLCALWSAMYARLHLHHSASAPTIIKSLCVYTTSGVILSLSQVRGCILQRLQSTPAKPSVDEATVQPTRVGMLRRWADNLDSWLQLTFGTQQGEVDTETTFSNTFHSSEGSSGHSPPLLVHYSCSKCCSLCDAAEQNWQHQ